MNYQNLIKNICEEEKIECTSISHNWGFVLKKNGVIKCILGYHFPLDDQAIGGIIDDKFALYDLCKHLNISIIEHQILWNPKSNFGSNSLENLKNYFYKYQKDVVLKPNNGTQGNGVFHITNESTLNNISKDLFKTNFSISICPFYDTPKEYRVIILDNVVKLSFEKERVTVVGDGLHSIKELLNMANPSYFHKVKFSKKDNKILKVGESFTYDWRFNLNKGAIAQEIKDENIRKKVEEFALSVAQKLHIRFASYDIINYNNTLYLMEINSGVCINLVTNFFKNGDLLAKEIYREAILKMFDN